MLHSTRHRMDAAIQKTMGRLGFPVGERTQTLIHGLRWNALAASISRVLCGFATLFVARWLGPARFGEANLALAATFWVQIPLFWGLQTALMHYVPQAKPEAKPAWVATGLVLLALSASSTLLLGFYFADFWATLHGVTSHAMKLALVWCAGFFLYTVSTTLSSGLERFKIRAQCELLFAVVFPALIVIFWKIGVLSASFYVLAMSAGYAVSGLISLTMIWPGRALAEEGTFEERAKKLLSFGLLAAMGGVVSALLNTPGRLIAHRYLTVVDVGVLSAYQGGSIQMSLFLVSIVAQVFFPIASRTPNRRVLFQKLNRFMGFSAPGVAIAYIGLIALYMVLLGKKYPLVTRDVLMFAAAATLSGFYTLLSWFVASKGRRGMVVTTSIGLVAGIVNVVGCYAAIPRWGVTGAGAAYALSALVGLLLCYLPFIHDDPRQPA